jgi:hypothetical protein
MHRLSLGNNQFPSTQWSWPLGQDLVSNSESMDGGTKRGGATHIHVEDLAKLAHQAGVPGRGYLSMKPPTTQPIARTTA